MLWLSGQWLDSLTRTGASNPHGPQKMIPPSTHCLVQYLSALDSAEVAPNDVETDVEIRMQTQQCLSDLAEAELSCC